MQNNYAEQNLKLREMQIKYSGMFYTLPDTYQEKNEAYAKAFNTGKNFIVGYDTFIYRTHRLEGQIVIGDNVTIGSHCTIDYSGILIIEDNAVISDGVRIFSHDHDVYKYTHKESNNVIPGKTVICRNAWIGAGSIILAGVKIGQFSVIGAGSVVTHDVPEAVIFGGNPAKYIAENKIKN